MNEIQASQVTTPTLNKMHQANYAVFQAKSEAELLQAIQNALTNCPFVSAYCIINEDKLDCKFSFNPQSKSSSKPALEQIIMTRAELANLSSREARITPIENSNLPAKLNAFFASSNCNQLLSLPIIQDGSLTAVLLTASGQNLPLTLENIDPIIRLAEAIPQAYQALTARMITLQRLNELETIAETSHLITNLSDLNSLFKTLHSRISATLGDVNFTVALYNSKSETVELPYVFEDGEVKSIDPFPLGEGVVSVILRTQQPLMFVVDAERHLNALGAKILGKPAKSWLGCPLVVANRSIGAMVVQDMENENRFGQDDLRILVALSSQVAGAINNIRLLEDTRRNSLELQTVAQISREVSGSLIIDDFLRQSVNLLHDKFNFYYAGVYLVETGGETIILREASGVIGMQMKRSAQKYAVNSKTIIGYVSRQKELRVINDVSKDPDYRENPLLPETRSEVCLPLMVGDRILGVLDVQDQHPYVFTEENIRILQILADQLSVAIVNSELFADAQERISQHRLLHHITTAAASSSTIQDVLNSAVQGLLVALGGDQISILMADKEQKTLEVKAAAGYPSEESAKLKIPFGVGVTGWAANHRQSLLVGDITKDSRYIAVNAKVRSELAIPLVYRNEVLGILNVESTRLNAYNVNDEEMLGTLAGSLAAIIAHSRLLDQYRQQVEREHLLSEISNKIRRTTNPDLILSIAANEISKALNTRRTQIEINIQNVQQTGDDLPVNTTDNMV